AILDEIARPCGIAVLVSTRAFRRLRRLARPRFARPWPLRQRFALATSPAPTLLPENDSRYFKFLNESIRVVVKRFTVSPCLLFADLNCTANYGPTAGNASE